MGLQPLQSVVSPGCTRVESKETYVGHKTDVVYLSYVYHKTILVILSHDGAVCCLRVYIRIIKASRLQKEYATLPLYNKAAT